MIYKILGMTKTLGNASCFALANLKLNIWYGKLRCIVCLSIQAQKGEIHIKYSPTNAVWVTQSIIFFNHNKCINICLLLTTLHIPCSASKSSRSNIVPLVTFTLKHI